MNQALNRLLQENKTAFYVFDIGKLKARIAHLQAALPPEVVLCHGKLLHQNRAGTPASLVPEF